jgi:hypothetical protein
MAQNLYEQMSSESIEALALALGFSGDWQWVAYGKGFCDNLRAMPALRQDFTLAEVARAYMEHVCSKLG